MGFSRQEYWSGVPLLSPLKMLQNQAEHGIMDFLYPKIRKKNIEVKQYPELCIFFKDLKSLSAQIIN